MLMIPQIGTYNAAVLAARHNIPFIVVAPITTIDLDIPDGTQSVSNLSVENRAQNNKPNRRSSIPIEQRPSIEACLIRGAVYPIDSGAIQPRQEAVMFTPPNIDLEHGVYNPSFDVTPAELITAIVTEKGVAEKGETGNFDLSRIV